MTTSPKFLLPILTAVLLAGSAQAQYTGDNQTNTISGVSSNWAGDYFVGDNFADDALLIQTGGSLSNGFGYVGFQSGDDNNVVLVTDPGSVWSNANELYVGYSGSGNSLTITNGSTVFDGGNGYIGFSSPSVTNNTVLVTGNGSVWSSTNDLFVGLAGVLNSLTIASSGQVNNASGYIGYGFTAINNAVLVTDSGSVWNNANNLVVGNVGAGNSLTIASSGTVYNATGYIGSNANNNAALVTGSGSVWNNSAKLFIGYSGSANQLIITNRSIVLDTFGEIGRNSSSGNNTVLVTDSGSVWSNAINMFVGVEGSDNTLTIANGGMLNDADGVLSGSSTSGNNIALVSDPGSVWSNSVELYVGEFGAGNSLIISNGGYVCDPVGVIGVFGGSSNNTVVVTGSGSVWSNANALYVGYSGLDSQLFVTNGGSVVASTISIAYLGGDGTLTVADGSVTSGAWVSLGTFGGTGTVFMTGGQLNVPADILAIGDRSDGQMFMSGGTVQARQLHIAGNAGPNTAGTLTFSGGTITSGDLMVGMSANSIGTVVITGGYLSDSGTAVIGASVGSSNNTVVVADGGSLIVTNAAGNGTLVISRAGGADSLILNNGGTVTANELDLFNGLNSILAFNGGILNSGGTFVAAPQTFVVGDGTDAAVFHLSGGVHSFGNNLEISNNAVLTGCGTINGNVLVDVGGTVLADCGGTLTVFGSVTNNGSIIATNGTFINFYGTVVNNGQIGPSNNVNYYPIPNSTADTNSWISPTGDKWENGSDWSAGPPSIIQPAVYITNASSKTVTIDISTEIAFTNTLTISNLTVSAPLNSTNALFVNNYGAPTPLDVLTSLTVGTNGAVLIANLPLHVDGANITNAGAEAVHAATVWVNGGELIVTNTDTDVGSSGVGTMTLSNGTALLGNVYVGQLAGSSGSMTVAGGTMTVSSLLSVGYNPAATGAVWVTGGQLVVTNVGIAVGDFGGVGQLNISNGLVMASKMNVGGWPGADGTLTVAGGTVSVSLGLFIGGDEGNGTGAVWVSGGELIATNDFTDVGVFGVGCMAVSNGTALLGNVFVGVVGGSSGSMTLAGGTMTVSSLSVGYNSDATGTVWVTGGQLVATNLSFETDVGYGGAGTMTVSNGTALLGSVSVGFVGGSSGSMTVAGGTMTVSSLSVGVTPDATGTVWITGGQLVATNLGVAVGEFGGVGQLTVSNGSVMTSKMNIGIGSGADATLTVVGGTVSVDQLVLTGVNSVIAFKGGYLTSSSTSVSNSQLFVVGDGTDAATFHLNGGVHSFADNLEISNNATLSGCGTIEGNVTIDPGGTVIADCGGTLTFTGIVTNNGTMLAVNGTTLQAYGQVVNNGVINAINGSTQFLGGLVNNGCVLTKSDVQISSITRSGPNIFVQIPSASCATYQLQVTPSLKPATWAPLGASQSGTGGVLTFTDTGGATNHPGRFYRFDVTLP